MKNKRLQPFLLIIVTTIALFGPGISTAEEVIPLGSEGSGLVCGTNSKGKPVVKSVSKNGQLKTISPKKARMRFKKRKRTLNKLIMLSKSTERILAKQRQDKLVRDLKPRLKRAIKKLNKDAKTLNVVNEDSELYSTNVMLSNLQNYMKEDYAMMRANESDRAVVYRTDEAKCLTGMLGQIVAPPKNFNGFLQMRYKTLVPPNDLGTSKGLFMAIAIIPVFVLEPNNLFGCFVDPASGTPKFRKFSSDVCSLLSPGAPFRSCPRLLDGEDDNGPVLGALIARDEFLGDEPDPQDVAERVGRQMETYGTALRYVATTQENRCPTLNN